MSEFEPTEADFDAVFGSKFLSASDIKAVGGKKRAKISKVEMAELRQDSGGTRRKFVIRFDGMDKGMVLNQTNAGILKDALGKNPARWAGAEVGILVEQVAFGNKRVDGLRLRVLSKPAAAPAPVKPAPTKPAPAAVDAELNDDPSDWAPDNDYVMAG
jgi:hypothetical protein